MSLWAGVAHRAAVADGVVEAAVAGVTGVAAGQRVTKTELLVRDATAGGAHGSALQLQRRRVLQDKRRAHRKVSSEKKAADLMLTTILHLIVGARLHQVPVLLRVHRKETSLLKRAGGVASIY